MRAIVLLCLAGITMLCQAITPIRLHPENARYFLFRGKPTVLITSGEHYGAVMNLDFDQRRYLDELKRHGFNLTRTFMATYAEGWGEPWNTLNPPKGRFISPWSRSTEPGFTDGGNKFDLSKWDPAYFERLKSFVREAGRRGVVVEVVLFCTFYDDSMWNLSPFSAASNVNGIGAKGRLHAWDDSDKALTEVQERYVRKTVSELKGFDNVYFELCNEPYFEGAPAIGHPWNDRMARAINEVSPSHLVALNVANGSAKVEKAPSGVSILNFHYSSPPTVVAENTTLRLPIAFDETGFRGAAADPYRREAWEFMLAGGAVYSNLDWTFSVASPDGHDLTADDKLGGKDPEVRDQLAVLKRFMEKLPLVRMHPMADAGVDAIADPGHTYALYFGDYRDLKLNLPKGRYRLYWVETKTGAEHPETTLDHPGGVAMLITPTKDGEFAVRIVK